MSGIPEVWYQGSHPGTAPTGGKASQSELEISVDSAVNGTRIGTFKLRSDDSLRELKAAAQAAYRGPPGQVIDTIIFDGEVLTGYGTLASFGLHDQDTVLVLNAYVWQSRLENLQRRFPGATRENLLEALAEVQGHGGRAEGLLLQRGQLDDQLLPPLHIAARSGDVDRVRELLDSRADPSSQAGPGSSQGDNTPLLSACRKGHCEVVKLLIEYQADVNVRNDNSRAAFEVTKNIHVVKALVDSQIELSRHEAIQLVHRAAHDNLDELAQSLIQRFPTDNLGIDLNTLCVHAMSGGQEELVLSYIEQGAVASLALMNAATTGNVTMARCLLTHGTRTEVNEIVDGRTVLHEAVCQRVQPLAEDAAKDFDALICFLLEAAADVNAKQSARGGEDGWTPLHVAANGLWSSVAAAAGPLLAARADVLAKSATGDTPFDVALRRHGCEHPLLDALKPPEQ